MAWWKANVPPDEYQSMIDDLYKEEYQNNPSALLQKQKDWAINKLRGMPTQGKQSSKEASATLDNFERIWDKTVGSPNTGLKHILFETGTGIQGPRRFGRKATGPTTVDLTDARLPYLNSQGHVVEATKYRLPIQQIMDDIDAGRVPDNFQTILKQSATDGQWQDIRTLQKRLDTQLTKTSPDDPALLDAWNATIQTQRAGGQKTPIRVRITGAEFEDTIVARFKTYDVPIGSDGRPVPATQWTPATNPNRPTTDNDYATLALIRQNDFRLRLQDRTSTDFLSPTQTLDEDQWRQTQGRLQDQYLS